MKLYEHFGQKGFHSSIVTSFGIDFDAYENIALARFRGAGCHNNLLVVDRAMLGLALDGASPLPRHAGRLYTVTGFQARGAFHPKIVLQFGRSSGRMIVSSANVTSSGLAGNLEVAGLVDSADPESGEARLVATGWRFLSRFLDEGDEGVRQQIDWMLARTRWLRDVEPADGVVTLSDGSAAGLFTSGDEIGIGERFLQSVGDEKVRRAIIISPYWDDDLSALHFLCGRIGAAKCFILLDQGRHVFPATAMRKKHPVTLIDFQAKDAGRFIHAKVVVLPTRRADHALFGSANCTLAALGNQRFGGTNAEACLYRALPAGAAVEALGLMSALASPPLRPEDLDATAPSDDIPMDELRSRHPGRFMCLFDTLMWWPSPTADAEKDTVEPLTPGGELLPSRLQRLPGRGDGVVRYRVKGERPALVRVRRVDGSFSTPGIVLVLDALREAVKDARSKRLDVAIAQLNGDDDVGLWLLETLNDIEAAESALREGNQAPARRRINARNQGSDDDEDRTLPYEEFVAGRRLRADAEVARSSLAGSELSRVRGYLNRLLGIGVADTATGGDPDEAVLRSAFDLGDDTADAVNAVESGDEFAPPEIQSATDADTEAEERRRAALLQRRANHSQLVEAVAKFQKKVTDTAAESGLVSLDVLRLRALLMVVATAGWDGKSSERSDFQVLPLAGGTEGAWPRLLAKGLYTYFGGLNPPIATLVIDDYYDQVPDDILECWATCMWSIQTVLFTCGPLKEYVRLMSTLLKLRDTIYRMVALRPDEMMDGRILSVFDALSTRFAKRLAFEGEEIAQAHRKTVASLTVAAA